MNEIPQTSGYFQTRDIKLAAALASHSEVGVFADSPVEPYHDADTGENYFVFKFHSSDAVREIASHWNTRWIEEHPDDPLAYIYAAFHNRERYLDLIRASEVRHIVRRGHRIYIIPDHEVQK